MCCSFLVVLSGFTRCIPSLSLHCVLEREKDTRVQRDIHDAATETMCSCGQHNKALSRTTWFEYTSDGKGERCTAPYASTHHIIFPQPWMRPSHRQPPLLSDSQSQNLSQHVFYTMKRKTLPWVCTEQNPEGGQGLSSGCKSIESFRERVRERGRALEKERDGLLFSEIWRAVSYYPQSFMWSQALFKPCLQNFQLQNWFCFCFFRLLLCFDEHWQTAVFPVVTKIGAVISWVVFNVKDQHQLRQHYEHDSNYTDRTK